MEVLMFFGLLVFAVFAFLNLKADRKLRELNSQRDRLVMERMDIIHNETLILSMAVWPDRKEEFEEMIIEIPKG